MSLKFAVLSAGRPVVVGQFAPHGSPAARLDSRTAEEIQAEIEITLARMRAQNIERLRREGPSAVLDFS